MANLIRMEITRYESGCGRSITVDFTITAYYSDREPFISQRISTRALLDELERGRVPRASISQVARYGGALTKEDGAWIALALRTQDPAR